MHLPKLRNTIQYILPQFWSTIRYIYRNLGIQSDTFYRNFGIQSDRFYRNLAILSDAFYRPNWIEPSFWGALLHQTGKSYTGWPRDSCLSAWWGFSWGLPLNPSVTYCYDVRGVLGAPIIAPPWCRETPVCDRCIFSRSLSQWKYYANICIFRRCVFLCY